MTGKDVESSKTYGGNVLQVVTGDDRAKVSKGHYYMSSVTLH